MDNEPRPTVWASLGTTVNIGNFENQKVDVGISGIPADASDEYLTEILDRSRNTIKTVINELANELFEKVKEIKDK